ncbi:MAG: 30S ribosomal protein S9 [Flavobacteriales bacterium]|jgi:small subunit ribosomal protein S9|nr:30S ribosomal protein S9 [Flavobacteriales bacterium]MBQ1968993.1 30S ribosomal protein S9 [Flavobacteriales bacterium]MBR4403173.1 30S ribosomal protein S9 [Flavobacteriales bacterium]
MATIHTIGRRKTAVARVFLSEGDGQITINKRPAGEYFSTEILQGKIAQPFELTATKGTFNVVATVVGGGINGQAEAIRLGISRALCEVNPEYRAVLKPEGLLTRDPRMVERKKFGQKKARKRFQFSKR